MIEWFLNIFIGRIDEIVVKTMSVLLNVNIVIYRKDGILYYNYSTIYMLHYKLQPIDYESEFESSENSEDWEESDDEKEEVNDDDDVEEICDADEEKEERSDNNDNQWEVYDEEDKDDNVSCDDENGCDEDSFSSMGIDVSIHTPILNKKNLVQKMLH